MLAAWAREQSDDSARVTHLARPIGRNVNPSKERAIQENFVANFRDKHLAQIEWLGYRRKT
jgi:hypothetical protein